MTNSIEIGSRFGILTIKKLMNLSIGDVWYCLCDCGNIALVSSDGLLEKNITSCTCLEKKLRPNAVHDLTGQKFGKLTVIEAVRYPEKDGIYWLCTCECGNSTMVSGAKLLSGHTKSCNCLKDENRCDLGKNTRKSEVREKKRLTFLESDGIEPHTRLSSLKNAMYGKKRNNKSGVTGVYFDKETKKWRAEIMVKGKKEKLGRFEKLEEAIKARHLAEKKYIEPILKRHV